MDKKKKTYVKPLLECEAFLPQEYVAKCSNPTSYVGHCDISGAVFTDSNDNHVYDEGIDEFKYNNTACKEHFESKIQPTKNAFIFPSGSKLKDFGHWTGPLWIADFRRVGVGTPVPIFNFKNTHACSKIDSQLHHNVSF